MEILSTKKLSHEEFIRLKPYPSFTFTDGFGTADPWSQTQYSTFTDKQEYQAYYSAAIQPWEIPFTNYQGKNTSWWHHYSHRKKKAEKDKTPQPSETDQEKTSPYIKLIYTYVNILRALSLQVSAFLWGIPVNIRQLTSYVSELYIFAETAVNGIKTGPYFWYPWPGNIQNKVLWKKLSCRY